MSATQRPSVDFVPRGIRRPLQQLRESYLLAKDCGRDVWRFAVRLSQLRILGLTDFLLEWLKAKGFIEQAPRRRGRKRGAGSRAGRGRARGAKAYLVLTDMGVRFANALARVGHRARRLQEPGGQRPASRSRFNPRPHWNRVMRELCYGDEVVKTLRQPSSCQERIFLAFEEQGWPRRIANPLPRQDDVEPKQHLNQVIKRLNRGLTPEAIHFRGDGTGEGILWEPIHTT